VEIVGKMERKRRDFETEKLGERKRILETIEGRIG
jgi:hypothetical protein